MAAPSVPHEELEHLKPGQLLRAFAFGVFTELPSLLDGVVPRFEISRACLDAVDRTLRIFDPTQTPENIRPVVKRKGDKLFAQLFAYGECPRAIANAVRTASEPMTAEQSSEQVALDCRLKTQSPDAAAILLTWVKFRPSEDEANGQHIAQRQSVPAIGEVSAGKLN
jgi:hypothetical protein